VTALEMLASGESFEAAFGEGAEAGRERHRRDCERVCRLTDGEIATNSARIRNNRETVKHLLATKYADDRRWPYTRRA
jgi:hypothetical protein